MSNRKKKKKRCKGITPQKDKYGPYYLVRVSRKNPVTGEELERRLKVRDTFAVAKSVKAEVAAELEAIIGGNLSPRMTLGDYARQWLEHKVKNLAHSSMLKYVNDLENHILPALGSMGLDELTPSHIRAMFARDEGAPNSQLNRLRLLRSIAKDAVADRLIVWDFTARISVKVPEVYTEEEPNILTVEELDRVLECIDDDWVDIACLMAFTGMRWCEVAGLQWDDIDLDKAELKIRRANVKGKIGKPKTRKSRRNVGLVDEVVDCLRARRARLVAAKHPGLETGWLVCQENGDLHRGYPMSKALRDACRDAGIVIRFTQHGRRRTFNDLARRRGRLLVIQATVGHTTDAMTEHYSHIRVDEKRALAQDVADDVRRSRRRRQAAQAEAEASQAEVEASATETAEASATEPEIAEASRDTEVRRNRHLDRHRHLPVGGSDDQNPE